MTAPASPSVEPLPSPSAAVVAATPATAPPPFDLARLALVWLAFLSTVAMLHWASAVCIPIVLSLLLTCALQPAVQYLWQRWRVPRALSAAALLLALVAGLAGTSWSLSDGASQLVDALPVATKKVRDQLRAYSRAGSTSTLATVQKAATQIEQATQDNGVPATRRGVQRVVVERPPFNVRDYVWPGTLGLVSGLAQLAAVVFLSFFLLASGDLLRRKLLCIVGPQVQTHQITLDMADEINTQVRRYLLVQLWTSALVGVATGLAYWALGLQQAAVWGVAAAVLNLVPYVGSLVVTGGSALVAFLQFGTPNMALAVGGASLFIHTLVGNLLTPWLTSRTSSLNPVAVFAGVMAWGWLWGVWGLLLGIPILIAVKAVCDRVAALRPVGELLGN
ncbi:AI-2E family transporter [Giesbergeria sinuosa]